MKEPDVENQPRGEERLVERIAARDPEALAEAYHAHAARLCRIAHGITRSISDAEDVVQDIFVELPEKLATFEGRSSLATWLYRVTVRAALVRVRLERRRSEVLIGFRGLGPPTGLDQPVNRVAVERALNVMPPRYRTVLWLKTVEGWKHSEIAETLGITENTSYQRLHRARKMLRRLVEEERGE